MILIVGGEAQGKRAYACSRFGGGGHVDGEYADGGYVDGETCKEEELHTAKGVYNLHLWIRRQIEKESCSDEEEIEEQLYRILASVLHKNPRLIIICNEVGCGLVPIEKAERKYRDIVGRFCIRLAEEAAEVHRVVCGIGSRIK